MREGNAYKQVLVVVVHALETMGEEAQKAVRFGCVARLGVVGDYGVLECWVVNALGTVL